MNTKKIIGVDMGGTKIMVGKIEGEKITDTYICKTFSEEFNNDVLNTLIDAISKVYDDEVVGIGIGVPGLVDVSIGKVLEVDNIPTMENIVLRNIISNKFGKPTHVNNDANCLAVGEKFFGKGKQYDNMVSIAMGTGLGAGIIANGHLYSGVASGAGEFGCLQYNGKTFEDFCSGKFFKDQFNIDGIEAYKMATSGDKKAISWYNQLGEHIGNAIKSILFTLAPQAIFLGGSVSKGFPLFQDAMWKSLQQFPFKKVLSNIVIEPSELQNIAVLGAAALCYDAKL